MSLAPRRLLTGLLGASLVIGLTAMPLSAAKPPPEKIYELSIWATQSGTNTAVSGAETTFQAKFTNLTPGNSSFNSFELKLPAGFTPTLASAPIIVAADPVQPSTVVVGWRADGSVTVQGLDPVRENRYVTIQFVATAPTTSGCASEVSGLWSAKVWTGSNLSGSEFNKRPPGFPTTTITGTCSLQFVVEPHDASQGDVITGVDVDPDDPSRVQVAVFNGATVDTSISGTVTLSVKAGTGAAGGVLTGNSATFSGGYATFSNLKISDASATSQAAGDYVLTATGAGFTADSAGFTIYDDLLCPDLNSPDSDYTEIGVGSSIAIDSVDPGCFGVTVNNSQGSFGGRSYEEWTVLKSSTDIFKGYLTFEWQLKDNAPIAWTQVTWEGLAGYEANDNYKDVSLCNAGVDYTVLGNYYEGPQGDVDGVDFDPLFPPGEEMCLVYSLYDNSLNPPVQNEIIAYNTDLGSRKY